MKLKTFFKISIVVLVIFGVAGCTKMSKEKNANVVKQKSQREVSNNNQSLNQKDDLSYKYKTPDGEIISVEPAIGRVKVAFKLKTPENIAKGIIVDNGGEVVEKDPVIDLYTVKVLPGNEISFRDKMLSNPQVEFAQQDYVASTLTTPQPPKEENVISSPQDTIEKATAALDNQDIDSFILNVPSYEKRSMKDKLLQFGKSELKRLSDTIKNATIVEQSDTKIKLEYTFDLADGTERTINFRMILEDGVWKIAGL